MGYSRRNQLRFDEFFETHPSNRISSVLEKPTLSQPGACPRSCAFDDGTQKQHHRGARDRGVCLGPKIPHTPCSPENRARCHVSTMARKRPFSLVVWEPTIKYVVRVDEG